jgi:hypothetical protein
MMHPSQDTALLADLHACITAILALAVDPEIPLEDRTLRLAQYADAFTGGYCPEVAFDPVACTLRALAIRCGGGQAAWSKAVRVALTGVRGPPLR